MTLRIKWNVSEGYETNLNNAAKRIEKMVETRVVDVMTSFSIDALARNELEENIFPISRTLARPLDNPAS